MLPGEGWTTDRKPNFVLRVRAWLALRKYRKAERTYRRLMWEMKTLEAEQESVLKTMAADNRAGRLPAKLRYMHQHAAKLDWRSHPKASVSDREQRQ